MSYCRFENTTLDIEDCLSAIVENYYSEYGPISDREAKALQRLQDQAEEILDLSEEIELILAKKNEE